MPLNATSHPLVTLSADEQAMLDRVRVLVADTIGPAAAAVAREDVFAWDTFRLLGREGAIATAFPRAWGGSDATLRLRVRIIEELASVCSTAASLVTGTDLSTRAIVAGGRPALKDRWLPALARGDLQSAFALTEPGAGSDVARLACQYSEAADGSLRLNGRKKFITRASTADCLVMVAQREGGPQGARGLSAFLVPRSAGGIPDRRRHQRDPQEPDRPPPGAAGARPGPAPLPGLRPRPVHRLTAMTDPLCNDLCRRPGIAVPVFGGMRQAMRAAAAATSGAACHAG